MNIRFGLLAGFVVSLSACGSGGGSGGGGSSASLGLIQTAKMSCAGSTCMGGGSLSLASTGVEVMAVNDAVTLYNLFNQSLIPALNAVVAKIEAGVKEGGAVSCNDISTNFNGSVTVSGTSYDAKTATSSLGAPTSFSTLTMAKKISARLTAGAVNYLEADFSCGAETDASPLVGRVIAKDGSNQLNAWYERGSTNHIRILTVVKYNGVNYAGWFKTDDGDNYQIILATNTSVYQGAGSRTAQKINFKDGGAAATCLNSVSGAAETCNYTLPTVTDIPGSLLTSGNALAWASLDNNTSLLAPTY